MEDLPAQMPGWCQWAVVDGEVSAYLRTALSTWLLLPPGQDGSVQ